MTDPARIQPVLVVDDDEDIRQTVSLVLRRAGCSVTTARGGRECLRALEDGFRGLILMDIMMPDFDGWSTVQAIVEAGWLPGNLICMLTACVDPRPTIEGLEQYIFDYVVKPFDVEELVDIVQLAVGQLEP